VGKPEKAIEVLTQVVDKYPGNANALFILAVAYTNNDNKDKALETFRHALKIYPDLKEAKKIIPPLKSKNMLRVNIS